LDDLIENWGDSNRSVIEQDNIAVVELQGQRLEQEEDKPLPEGQNDNKIVIIEQVVQPDINNNGVGC